MIKELDTVVLTLDLSEHGLRVGDIGTVVLVHGDHEGYELEFVTLTGDTIAVISVYPDQIRAIQAGEIAHARTLEFAAS